MCEQFPQTLSAGERILEPRAVHHLESNPHLRATHTQLQSNTVNTLHIKNSVHHPEINSNPSTSLETPTSQTIQYYSIQVLLTILNELKSVSLWQFLHLLWDCRKWTVKRLNKRNTCHQNIPRVKTVYFSDFFNLCFSLNEIIHQNLKI